MKIISFAWTTPAIKARRKSCTRRDWADDYAARFKPGDLCQAWDKTPRCTGAKRIGTVRIISVTKERYCDAPAVDWYNEGFQCLTELCATCNGAQPIHLWHAWHSNRETCWVARFEIVDVFDGPSSS